MGKIIQQFLKFGVVGALCFVIDTGLYTICNFIGIPYLISGVIGFSISVVVNYLLSMKYVFVRRDDLSRKKEFTIDLIYGNWTLLQELMHPRAAEILAKIGATGIVMVYNFITRKIFMEKKD